MFVDDDDAMNDGIFMRLFTIFQKFNKQLHKNVEYVLPEVHSSSLYNAFV